MRCRAWLLLLALPRAGSLAQRADRAAVVKLYHLLNGPWCDLPPELGKLTSLVYLRLYNNALTADLSRHGSIGELEQLEVLDLYNNSMVGDMPPQFANLKSLKYLYLQNEHYWPLRHFYCRQRLPKATWGKGGTKYNWVVVAQMYETMTTSTVQGDRRCIDPHDTTFAFNSLQDSGVLAMG